VPTGEQPGPAEASNVGEPDTPSASEATGAEERPAEPPVAPEQRARPAAAPRRRRRRGLLLALLVLAVAGALGLATGVLLVRRGRALGSDSSTAEAVVRPTFVISTAASPVVPGASPSAVNGGPPPRGSGPTPGASTTSYTVEPGDTLRSIAQKVYGDANQWPRLYEANRDAIGANPDNLQAGMQLNVP
jgi:nucleoid-associated protein YgaU